MWSYVVMFDHIWSSVSVEENKFNFRENVEKSREKLPAKFEIFRNAQEFCHEIFFRRFP